MLLFECYKCRPISEKTIGPGHCHGIPHSPGLPSSIWETMHHLGLVWKAWLGHILGSIHDESVCYSLHISLAGDIFGNDFFKGWVLLFVGVLDWFFFDFCWSGDKLRTNGRVERVRKFVFFFLNDPMRVFVAALILLVVTSALNSALRSYKRSHLFVKRVRP